MRSTVITDASFCPRYNVGGWAAWVAMDDGKKVKTGGPLNKQAPENSVQAELMASINGLWIARQLGATDVLLQTDCQAVFVVIQGRSKSEALNQIWAKALNEFGLWDLGNIRLKHVKGHTTVSDARSWVNRWCDSEAKSHMRRLRRE